MPAAVLVGGLTDIAFAFAAISAALLISTLVVNPVRTAAAEAAGVAIVGGVIAWVLTQLANIIEIGIGGMAWLAQQGQQQAANWWNYLVHETVFNQFWVYFNEANTFNGMLPSLVHVVSQFDPLASFVNATVWPFAQRTWGHLIDVNNTLSTYTTPLAERTFNDLAGLHQWIDNFELPLIRGIGNDLAGLRDWVGRNAATHSEVANARDQAIARAQALAIPIVAAIEAVENSPCMQSCEPLGDLGQVFQYLEDAGFLALMAELLQVTISDPLGVQQVLRDDLVPLVRDVADMFGVST